MVLLLGTYTSCDLNSSYKDAMTLLNYILNTMSLNMETVYVKVFNLWILGDHISVLERIQRPSNCLKVKHQSDKIETNTVADSLKPQWLYTMLSFCLHDIYRACLNMCHSCVFSHVPTLHRTGKINLGRLFYRDLF